MSDIDTIYGRYFDAIVALPYALRVPPMDLIRQVEREHAHPLPFLVSLGKDAQPYRDTESGSGSKDVHPYLTTPPTLVGISRQSIPTRHPPLSSGTRSTTLDLPPAGSRGVPSRESGPSTSRSWSGSGLMSVRLRTEQPEQVPCSTCGRTYREGLADQQRLNESARGTVRIEEGHKAMEAVCAECLMPFGYGVEAYTTDPNAPTEPQRGPKRWQDWKA